MRASLSVVVRYYSRNLIVHRRITVGIFGVHPRTAERSGVTIMTRLQ